ncbi:soma ferritin-like isoform X1 [Haliotis cracherodii]|uniref:soma ferritin-like isoform X1 n=2 Tax=Haliotis cracherodii TaxID=6455 RepID=UPI0039EB7684
MPESQARQNYHANSEAGVNKQINVLLNCSYVYQSMSWYFDRDDVALKGFFEFLKDASCKKREFAEKMMKYQNQRGGRIVLQDIKKPRQDEWGTGLDVMQSALALEKNVNQEFLDLHKVADCNTDPQMMDFLEDEFLEEEVEMIKKLSDHVTNLKRVGPGLGEYQFDHETLS